MKLKNAVVFINIILLILNFIIFYLLFRLVFDVPLINPCPGICAIQIKAVEPTKNVLYQGKVSYYSHDGCIGCNKNQIMGNRQPFNENAITLAIPCEDVKTKKNPKGKYTYGTKVKVWNMSNGWVKSAVITDCGGFGAKYNRVADLSLGLCKALECKTDKSIIQIYIEKDN